MVFDFAARTPEVNAALISSGAGAGPMMAAASAFSGLGSELTTAGTSFQSVIAQLVGADWLGPSSTLMATAAQELITWLHTIAEALQHAATQAIGSAAAFETAIATMVPVPVIAENRAELAVLVATNILGQNSGAIAANQAQYGAYWANNAATMYTYAANSAAHATLQPLSPPADTTNPAAQATQAVGTAGSVANSAQAAGLNGLLGNVQGAINSLAGSGAAAPIWDLYDAVQGFFGIGAVGDTVNTLDVTLSWCIAMLTAALCTLGHFIAGAPFGFTVGDVAPIGDGVGFGTTLAGAAGGAGGAIETPAVLAGMGASGSVGELTVPASWSAATPEAAEAATLAGWTAPAEEASQMTAVPAGMPAVAGAGRGGGIGGPRYGIKPRVMPQQVLV